MKIINQNFIRFVSGFVSIIFITLLFAFVVGFYESEMVAGGNRSMKVINNKEQNRGAVGDSPAGTPSPEPVRILQGRPMDWEPEYPPKLE